MEVEEIGGEGSRVWRVTQDISLPQWMWDVFIQHGCIVDDTIIMPGPGYPGRDAIERGPRHEIHSVKFVVE